MEQRTIMADYQFFKKLTHYSHFDTLLNELSSQSYWSSKKLRESVLLANAISQNRLYNIHQVNHHPQLRDLNTESHFFQRLIYTYAQLSIRAKRGDWADYLRLLTPFFVDLFRSVVENLLQIQLSDYLIPAFKTDESGNHFYRGMQWDKLTIESSDNLIYQTWQKYYGQNFSYDHYLSSSHLVKIIEMHSNDSDLIALIQSLRSVEKYLRNLAAHEAVPVDEHYFKSRMNLTIEDVQSLITRVLKYLDIKDIYYNSFWELIQQEILYHLKHQYQQLLKENNI